MRESDQQLGKPLRAYRNTKANIAALGLGAADEGCMAYATDTNEFGSFDGAAWTWSDHALLSARHYDVAPNAPTRGSLIYGSAAPAWDELDHPAAAGYALTTDANDVVWDQTPLWSGAHTHAADIILDDGVGDSPQLQLIGGSNNDTVLMYLDDDAVAGDSDLVIRLCAADTGSQLIIQDNSPAMVAYIDADGNADFIGHMAVGASASVASTSIVNVDEVFTPLAGTYIGVYSNPTFTPAAASAAKIRAMQFTVTANAAVAMTGNVVGVAGNVVCAAAATLARMSGLECKVFVSNGIAANITDLEGLRLAVINAEDAAVSRATAILVYTPSVDTGTITTGYGIRMREGTKGAGVYTTQYGILVESINNAVTNYAIYTNAGLVYFGDNVGIGISPPDGTLHVHTATAGAVAADAAADDLVVENSVSGGISILVPDNQDANLYFGSPSDNLGAMLRWEFDQLRLIVGTAAASGYVSLRSANAVEAIRIDPNQYIGIGITVPLAQCHIDQASTTVAIPVLTLDQADVSEGFINFIGSDRGVILSDSDSLRSVRVEWNGTVYRLALHVDA